VSLKGFLFLLVVTVLTVMAAGLIAERFAEPGLQRTAVVAVIAALVVFPAAKWAEWRGWIKGSLQLHRIKNEFIRPRNEVKRDEVKRDEEKQGEVKH
jgi:hypothetical protein